MVNDAIYAGQLSVTGHGPVAFLDISGVARVEFSLYQLKDSKPWGVLHDRTITLTNPDEETTIQISSVRNGMPPQALPGGPYRVWVRWSDPSKTVEEQRGALLVLRARMLDDHTLGAGLVYLDKQLARDPSPWIDSSGIRGLKPGERVESDDGP